MLKNQVQEKDKIIEHLEVSGLYCYKSPNPLFMLQE